VAKGWDHDPPAEEELTPFGILRMASGALMLVFGSRETSDAWADALGVWRRLSPPRRAMEIGTHSAATTTVRGVLA
jgi:hypothetical protein